MKSHATLSTIAFLLGMSSDHFAFAEDGTSVGETRAALPGINRVPIVGSTPPRLIAALDGGYGFTESQNSEGSHHRAFGSLGLGYVPIRGLEYGLRGAIRYDRHPDDGLGSDSGTIGHFAAVSRWGTVIGRSLRLGADLGAAFPGAEKPADCLTSPAIDLRALLGWVPSQAVRVAGFGGFRLDYSAGSGGKFARYRAGDRLALGVSDFNAVLAGAGVIVPVGGLELLGEITADLLVGSGAPKVSESPIRMNLGVRRVLAERLTAELLSEVALSSRPEPHPNAPLVPVEPRLQIVAGMRYRIWGSSAQPRRFTPPEPRTAAPSPPAVQPRAVEPAVPQPPVTSRVVVTVVDGVGDPISDAVVNLTTQGRTSVLEFEKGSVFAADEIPIGKARVSVQAERMRDWEQDIEITRDQAVELLVAMAPSENSGQIRGLVRAFDGSRLPARVRIEPLGRDVVATANGEFSVDVPPGKYRVLVSVEGYEPQVRAVEVQRNGVMVLNVDLRKGK